MVTFIRAMKDKKGCPISYYRRHRSLIDFIARRYPLRATMTMNSDLTASTLGSYSCKRDNLSDDAFQDNVVVSLSPDAALSPVVVVTV